MRLRRWAASRSLIALARVSSSGPRFSARRMLPRIWSRASLMRLCPACGARPRGSESCVLRVPACRALAPDIAQHARRDRGRGPIERRALRKIGPDGETGAVRRRRELLLELALAPVTHHARQRDLHRADAFAAA